MIVRRESILGTCGRIDYEYVLNIGVEVKKLSYIARYKTLDQL